MVELVADYLDLLECLGTAGARFVLVGGYALNVHGVVRATEDLDLFLASDDDNLARVLEGMAMFGLPPGLTIEALRPREPRPSGFRFGRRPISVDLLTSIAGVEFEDVWVTRQTVDLQGLAVPVIGLEALRRNKQAAGRPRDLADLHALGEG